MIELYDNAGTESYGCFDSLKNAGGVLASLASRGVKSVTASKFRGCKLQGVYRVPTEGKPRIVHIAQLTPTPIPAA